MFKNKNLFDYFIRKNNVMYFGDIFYLQKFHQCNFIMVMKDTFNRIKNI